MSCRASIVLFHTPHQDVEHVKQILRASGEVEEVQLIDNEHGDNKGYGKGHNIAIRASIEKGTTYHLVMNSDLDFKPEALKELINYMDAHPDVALIQPKMQYPDGRLQALAKLLPTPMDMFGRRFLSEKTNKVRNDRFELRCSGYDKIMNVPYLSGCFMLLRVSALKQLGLFDERFFLYPEDIDLTRRLHVKYKTLFYPYVTVIHWHERASYNSLRLMWVHIINMCRYFNKWGWWHDEERDEINRRVLEKIRNGEYEG